MSGEELKARARKVRLILMDVDGVLTDGRIWYVPRGTDWEEVKTFDVADGAGIVLAHRNGLKTGIVSGRAARVIDHRAAELGIEDVHLGVRDKGRVVGELISDHGLEEDQVAFIGDEIVDLPAFQRVGFPVAVANATDDVKRNATYVTEASGERGTVREVIELILKSQDK